MPDWLEQRAALTPERLALVCGEHRRSFAQLNREVRQTALSLGALGIGAEDRVAVLLGNGPPFVQIVHALPRLGAVLLPLNTRLAPAEIAWQLEDAGVRYLIHDSANAERVKELLAPSGGQTWETIPWEEIETTEPPAASATGFLRQEIDLSSIHTIIYTSGTTGRPKGAMLTYGNHWWSASGSALNLGHHHTDRWLAPLPLFHVGGLSILLKSVIYGIPAILQPSFDPAAVNRAMDEHDVTIVSVVAAMLRRMLDDRGERSYPPTLRCVLLGGGPAPRPLLEECAARGLPVIQTYGLTEAASQVTTLAPEDALSRLGSAGKPLFPTQVRIVRDGEITPAGQVGEIAVHGPTIMRGYVNGPEIPRNGWFLTGDLGYVDSERYLYVLDRREDLIISGGENIYPAEIEAVLLSHPAVKEAAVAGVPDERWGQVAGAAVAVRPGMDLSSEEILSFCAERLARFKLPGRIRVVDALPRNAAGKPLRHAVRDLLMDNSPSGDRPD